MTKIQTRDIVSLKHVTVASSSWYYWLVVTWRFLTSMITQPSFRFLEPEKYHRDVSFLMKQPLKIEPLREELPERYCEKRHVLIDVILSREATRAVILASRRSRGNEEPADRVTSNSTQSTPFPRFGACHHCDDVNFIRQSPRRVSMPLSHQPKCSQKNNIHLRPTYPVLLDDTL